MFEGITIEKTAAGVMLPCASDSDGIDKNNKQIQKGRKSC